jgi:hypothetical protein
MKCKTLLLPVVAVLAFAAPAQSQTLIAQYFRCSTADEGEADFIMNEVFEDVFESHVESGELIGWGWVEHLTGGAWRRISTMTASDPTAAWDAWGSIVEEITDDHPNAWHRFNEICPSHDDYIWNVQAVSDNENVGTTPDTWASTYWVCDATDEPRADELMQQMTPAFDKHIAAGNIGGWGWYEHLVGGRFRRLLTLTEGEAVNILEGREMVVAELRAEHADALEEFGNICGSHVDYIWANAAEDDDEDDD